MKISQYIVSAAVAALAFTLLAPSNASAQNMGNTLKTNQTLTVNQYLSSTNNAYKLVMQGDGNLALYSQSSTYISGIGATAGRRAVLQGDGNFCVYSDANINVYCNYSNGAAGDYFLMLRDSGDLEVYQGTPANTGASKMVWTSLLDAAYYGGRYPDLGSAFSGDKKKLMAHWLDFGRYEGRSPKNGVSDQGRVSAMAVNLDTVYYATKYADLKAAFGFDAQKLYEHWMNNGRAEGRYPNKSIEDFLSPPPRSAHLRDVMRAGDWLSSGERMESSNKRFRLDLQPDAQFAIYEGAPSSNSLRWARNDRAYPQDVPYFISMQSDGHMCIYKGKSPADNRGLISCVPEGAGGPVGRYFAAIQSDGNLAIYKGGGPADNRGWIWDRITTKPSNSNIFTQAIESITTFVVSHANIVAAGATGAANTVAVGTTGAANAFAREAAAGAAIAINAVVTIANKTAKDIVNTANLVANTSEMLAVQAGAQIEVNGKILGAEIVKNGQIVGYAVTNLANEAWSFINQNCGSIGRRVFPIDKYFEGAKRITGDMMFYGSIDPKNGAAVQAAANAANQCFEWAQDGFYCAFPKEIESMVSRAASMPGSLINLSTRVFNEARTDECMYAGAATAAFTGPGGFVACGLGKVVVSDAEKAFRCFSAANAKGFMKKYLPGGGSGAGQSYPTQQMCNGMGHLAFKVAKRLITKDLVAQAKAAQAAGRSGTIEMVAEELRSAYSTLGSIARYDQLVGELNQLKECQ